MTAIRVAHSLPHSHTTSKKEAQTDEADIYALNFYNDVDNHRLYKFPGPKKARTLFHAMPKNIPSLGADSRSGNMTPHQARGKGACPHALALAAGEALSALFPG